MTSYLKTILQITSLLLRSASNRSIMYEVRISLAWQYRNFDNHIFYTDAFLYNGLYFRKFRM